MIACKHIVSGVDISRKKVITVRSRDTLAQGGRCAHRRTVKASRGISCAII